MFVSKVLVFLQFLFLLLMFLPYKVMQSAELWVPSLISFASALSILIWTSLHNRPGNFNIVPEIKEGCVFIQTGPYHFIRHPMYSSAILIAISALLYSFALWKLGPLGVLVFVLYIKAKREEGFWCKKKSEYKDYKKKTKMFIPFVL